MKHLVCAQALVAGLAANEDEIRQTQRLRYQIFADEMGARLPSAALRLDIDDYDAHCEHLMVCDAESGAVVGCTRLLGTAAAQTAGGFYSASEFDLAPLLPLMGRNVIEIGRTCIRHDYRSGGTIAVLWSALSVLLIQRQVGCLIGCASIPLQPSVASVARVCHDLLERHGVPSEYRARPYRSLPDSIPVSNPRDVRLPPLLKAYLRIGANIGGPACHDPAFNVADVLIHLPTQRINRRYARHFLNISA